MPRARDDDTTAHGRNSGSRRQLDRGGSEKQSYVSPWYAATIKYRDFDRHQGTIASPIVDEAVERLRQYTSSAPE